jgi:antitoxin (DNA-binding transcriptional repressor) of toxin-antitoxin stability system
MKTITMMQLRASPGEYAFRVRADGESFLVTYQGKPCFKMVPVEDVTVVRPDGSIKGPKPLTMGLDLGGEYGGCERSH